MKTLEAERKDSCLPHPPTNGEAQVTRRYPLLVSQVFKKAIVIFGRLKRLLFGACRMILSVITHLLTEKQELVALPEGRSNYKCTWIQLHLTSQLVTDHRPRITLEI